MDCQTAPQLPRPLALRLRLRQLRGAGCLTRAEEAAAARASGCFPVSDAQRAARNKAWAEQAAWDAEHPDERPDTPPGIRAPVLRKKGSGMHEAQDVEKAECPICFERYCPDVDGATIEPHMRVCVLLDRRGRHPSDAAGACRHFFHTGCVDGLSECPMCRRPFACAAELPNIADRRNHQRWFQLIDVDGDGALSQREVVDVLRVTMPVTDDRAMIERYVAALWPSVVRGGRGDCQMSELPRLFAELGKRLPGHEGERQPPQLTPSTKREWFRFWDEDGSGGLDKQEVMRAMSKTFRAFGDAAGAKNARVTLENVWFLFDDDGDGGIDIDEFCRADGLADAMILANGASLRESPQQAPGGPGVAAQEWACSACTYRNRDALQSCELCGTPR